MTPDLLSGILLGVGIGVFLAIVFTKLIDRIH
jgi:F0F1-type ATP synthase assembly protein I